MEIPQTLSITLEIVPEDVGDIDPAAVNTFAFRAVNLLEEEGYAVEPIYTGQRGGLELLFQFVVTSIQTIGPAIMAQKDVIGVISALCAIFATLRVPVSSLFHAQQKQSPQEHDITVKIKIDEAEIEITSRDISNDERIMQLAERFYALHPQVKVTPQSTAKVRAHVPRPARKRRR